MPVEDIIIRRVMHGHIEKEKAGCITSYKSSHDGINVSLIVFDYSYKAGTIGYEEAGYLKRIFRYRPEEKEIIYIVLRSGGARIDDGPLSLEELASAISELARPHKHKVIVTIVDGVAAGGGALITYLSDIKIASSDRGAIFIHGPKIYKNISGVDVDITEFGGAQVHSEETGIINFTYDNEDDIAVLIGKLHEFMVHSLTRERFSYDIEKDDYAIVRCCGKCSGKLLLKLMADNGFTLELNRGVGDEVSTSLCYIGGWPTAFIGIDSTVNDGRIGLKALLKIKNLVRLARNLDIPIVYLCDSPGILDTPDSEKSRLISVFVDTLIEASKHRYKSATIVIGGCYGPSYILTSSLSLVSSIIFLWRDAKVGVLSPRDAYNIGFKRRDGDPDIYEQWFIERYTNIGLGEHGERIKEIDVEDTKIELIKWLSSVYTGQ